MTSYRMTLRSNSRKPEASNGTPLESPIKLTEGNLTRHTKREMLATLHDREPTPESDAETDHSPVPIAPPPQTRASRSHRFATIKEDLSQAPATPANKARGRSLRRITNAPKKSNKVAPLNLAADAATETSSVYELEHQPTFPNIAPKQRNKPLGPIPRRNSSSPSKGSLALKEVYDRFGSPDPNARSESLTHIFLRESRRLSRNIWLVKATKLVAMAAKIKKNLERSRLRRLRFKKQRKGIKVAHVMRFLMSFHHVRG